MIKQDKRVRECRYCKKRQFQYGVMHQGRFMSYSALQDKVKRGHVVKDATFNRLSITNKSFGLDYAARKK